MNIDLKMFQELEKVLVTEIENRAKPILEGVPSDWSDYKHRVGVLKGLRDALKIAKEVNDDLLGVDRKER